MRFPSQIVFFGIYVTASKHILLMDLILSILEEQIIIIILVLQQEKFEDQGLDYCLKPHELAWQV